MKPFLILLFAFNLFLASNAQPTTEVKSFKIKMRGMLSSDTENVKREPDPAFTSKLVQKKVDMSKVSGPTTRLSSMSNGIQIVQEAVNDLAAEEHKFVLLSGHKYMVNSCLGLKVSAGEFYVKFKNPFVGDSPLGIKIKLEVDKIELNVLKIRIKPRSPDLSDPNPCHFSGKFEISGEAKDLSVTAYIDPVASGAAPALCFIGYQDAPKLDWNMTALKFLDFANSLDKAGRDMIYDGLDLGMHNLLMDKMIDLLKKAFTKYYQLCDDVYWEAKDLIWSSSADGKSTYEAVYGSPVKNDPYEIKKVNKKVNTGRVYVTLPRGAAWDVTIYPAGSDKVVSNTMLKTSFNLLPGKYDLEINKIMVRDIVVEKGNDTRIKAGVLRIANATSWTLYDASKEKVLINSLSATTRGIPVGKYILTILGRDTEIEIKDGETLEF